MPIGAAIDIWGSTDPQRVVFTEQITENRPQGFKILSKYGQWKHEEVFCIHAQGTRICGTHTEKAVEIDS